MINTLILFILSVPPLIFFTDLTRNPYYFQIVLLNASTVFLWMYWLYAGYKKKELTFRSTPLDIPLLSFVIAATLSLLLVFVQNLGQPYLKFGISSEGLKRWLYLIVNCVLAYYAAANFTTDDNRNKYIMTAVWAGLAASVYAVMQYFGMEFIWPKVLNPFGGRSVSTFGNPNFLSSYLVLLLPLVFVYMFQAQSNAKRNFFMVMLGTIYAALLCTMTRSSWLGTAAAFAFLLWALWRFEADRLKILKKLMIFCLVAACLLAVFWPKSSVTGYSPTVIERLSESANVSKSLYGAWDQRRLIWSCAWHMIVENPFLGKGWGCFELLYPFYQGRHLFLPSYHPFRTHANNTHNEILEIWSQTGIIGFGLYLWLLACVVAFGMYLIKNSAGEKRLLSIALLASLIGMWVDNLLNVSLHFAVPGFLYWWNMGLLASLGKREDLKLVINKPYIKALILGGLVIGSLLIIRYSRNFLAEIHYFNGFKASKMNDLQRAIPELEAAHSLQRLEVNNNYELGNCYARSGRKDKAIWAYKESLRANAGYDEIYFNMATVMMQMGNTGEAIYEYTRSLYINPISYESYMALGSVFLPADEKYGEACAELFKQCLHFYPNNRDIWNNLGYLYTKLGRENDAIEAYKNAIQIDPNFELAKRNLTTTAAKIGKKDDFIQRTETLFRKVENGIMSKKWDEALVDCEKLVSEAPKNTKARLYMANIYFTVGQMDKAVNEYKTLISMDPRNISGLTNLALVYSETKQYEYSKQMFEQVLQYDPNNQIARQKLEEIKQIMQSTSQTNKSK